MYRFIAFAWTNCQDGCADAIRSGVETIAAADGRSWSCAHRAPGLEVWHTGSDARCMTSTPLPEGGVLLGRALSRAAGYPSWRPSSLRSVALSDDPSAQAKWLFANIWGSYVVFLPPQHGHPQAVARDPSGGLPCYRVQWDGFEVFASHADTFRDLPKLLLSVNFDALVTNALLPLVSKASTGLNEVHEILAGECLYLGDQTARQFLWSPIAFATDPLLLGVDEAAELLRDTLRDIVKAVSRPHKHVLHHLGGLDSSILLTCLTDNPERAMISCVNFYTNSYSGDERHYAREMASHVGVPLIEGELRPERVELDFWRTQEMGATPPAMFDCLTLASDLHRLAEALDADAQTYGTGGDSIFFQAPFVFPALDYVTARAPLSGLPRVALEAAQYGGKSLVSTIADMCRERLRPQSCFESIVKLIEPDIVRDFLHPAFSSFKALPEHLHPMLRPNDELPKGKYYQLLGASFFNAEGYGYHVPHRREFTHVFPLMTQPFIELCLRLPTWQLAEGGVSRGLARRAFQRDLPRNILGRTSKSAIDGLYKQVFARNVLLLRETLLDGILVKAKFLNRDRLEKVLNEDFDQLSVTDPGMLLDFYAWEVWASRWGA
jgi:asparagine synthase (glutamine-hydrolysing)